MFSTIYRCTRWGKWEPERKSLRWDDALPACIHAKNKIANMPIYPVFSTRFLA